MTTDNRTKIELSIDVINIEWPEDSGRNETELGIKVQLYLDEAELGGTKFGQLAKAALEKEYGVEPINLKVVGAKLHILEEDKHDN